MIILISNDKRIPIHLKNYTCHLVSYDEFLNKAGADNGINYDPDGGFYFNLDVLNEDIYQVLQEFQEANSHKPDLIRYYRFDDQNIGLSFPIYEGITIYPSNLKAKEYGEQFLTSYDTEAMQEVVDEVKSDFDTLKEEINNNVEELIKVENITEEPNTEEIEEPTLDTISEEPIEIVEEDEDNNIIVNIDKCSQETLDNLIKEENIEMVNTLEETEPLSIEEFEPISIEEPVLSETEILDYTDNFIELATAQNIPSDRKIKFDNIKKPLEIVSEITAEEKMSQRMHELIDEE